ncbi:hypothetical protein ANCCEY_02767 [Ancylostoma ceylanicum]|uniref:BED-type domain-containing protein n=1 Tax=Ancylostoma ceylanicum TaxID=53326 RepID=A0A0D6MBY6_9BILA|nr:hypothetical protein ANCCEY_02767 [Ancylostoma ceylanicum]
MDTAYLPTSYSYEDKDYFEPSVAVLQTPCSFQQPQHGHLYPIVPQPIPIQGGTQLPGNDQYEQSLSLQPSMFYYAAAAAAGPSLISQQDQPPAVLQNKTTVDDDNGAGSNGARKRGTKRGRPTKNPVWTFFRRIDDKSVQCNMCARLVKSACATNMSKHLERHHQNAGLTAGGAMDRVDFTVQKVVTSYDHYQGIPDSQRQMAGVPWNPDRRGAKRNRRTKHPVGLGTLPTDHGWKCPVYSVQRGGPIAMFQQFYGPFEPAPL